MTSGPRRLSASKLSLGPEAEESDKTERWRKILMHPPTGTVRPDSGHPGVGY